MPSVRAKARARDVRKATRRLRREDLYDPETGLLKGVHATDERVYAWFQRRHERGLHRIDYDGYYRTEEGDVWKVPIGVRLCLTRPLLWRDVVKIHPWFVTWRGKNGTRYKKFFGSPYGAIHFIATKAQYVDRHAALVHKNGFDIPAELRGKIPKPWKWCPRCMTARKFKAVYPQETFFASRKEWVDSKARYEYRDRKLRLMACGYCGLTNRDSTMRRSNQPWEVRKFRRGVRRAKKRR